MDLNTITPELQEQENKEIKRRYKELLRVSYQKLSEEDKELIRLALDVAIDGHKHQRRKSGEPYIYHPIAVAKIVCEEIGLGGTAIACALLHDVVEDSPDYDLDRITEIFGEKISSIIDGLTKINHLQKDSKDISIQSENFRKLILTLSNDVRVILVKIADRLHNMRTLDFMKPHKQKNISSETLYIYAPLAHRLGLYNIKSELEDIALRFVDPENYNHIEDKLSSSKEELKKYVKNFSDKIDERLKKENLEYSIQGRPKSIFSINRKMKAQNIPFEEVFDRFAVRIIYKSSLKEEKFTAWKIYSIITDQFTPNPTRLRDWISSPKSTGYEALHITVLDSENKWVEVQIRSERMHEVAEKGYAAHYKYKQGDEKESGMEHWLDNIRDALENPDSDAVNFVEDFKLNLFAKEIFVFTPKGDIIKLPKESTALDFAYEIHTDLGNKCLGTKVNGKLVPLNHQLKSGNTVEVITSNNQKPKHNWLQFVHTTKARTKIKASLKEEKRLVSLEGKEILRRKLKQLKIDLNEKTLNDLVVFFGESTSQDVYYKVGLGVLDSQMIRKFAHERTGFFGLLKKIKRKSPQKFESSKSLTKTKEKQLVFGADEQEMEYTLSSCCNPLPGNDVFGFLTIGKGIKVHRNNCPNAVELRSKYAYRILKAKWKDLESDYFETTLSIEGIDGFGIINQLTNKFKTAKIEMKSISFSTEAEYFKGKVKIELKNENQLKEIIKELKEIKAINKVVRI